MRVKKLIALSLGIVIMILSLCACDKKIFITVGLKDSEIFKLSGEPCTMAEMMLVLMTEKSRYEADLGEGIWLAGGATEGATLEDDIKQKVKNEMVELKTIDAFARKQKIQLSDEEKANIKSAAKEYMETLDEKTAEVMNVKLEDVESLYTSFYMVEKVYEKITADVSVEISDEEARVIEVNYIFIATCRLDADNQKIEFSENELAQAKAKSEEVLSLIEKGSDFAVLAEQYSDSTSHSRVFGRGEMIEAFEDAAFKLETGQTSGVIETEDGYYFIKCIDDYLEDKTASKKAQMADDIKKKAYDNLYNPFKDKQTLEFNNKIWNSLYLKDYGEVSTLALYETYNKYMN